MAESKKKIQGKTAEQWFEEGREKGKAEQWDDAIECYTNAIELKSDYAEAHNNRGNAWNAKGEWDKAIKDYDKAIELNPDYANAYNNRGVAWKNKGEYNKAIADYDKALELKPDDTLAIRNRGVVIAQQAAKNLAGRFEVDVKESKKRGEKERDKARDLTKVFYRVLTFLGFICLFFTCVILSKIDLFGGFSLVGFFSDVYIPIAEAFAFGIISFPLVWALRIIKTAQDKAEILSELFFNSASIDERIALFAQQDLNDSQKEFYGTYFKKITNRGPEEVLLEMFQGKQDGPPATTPSQLIQNFAEKSLTKDSSTN